MTWVWLNGEFLDDSLPALSARDRGFLYGDGLFETMRAYKGRVFQFPEHMARMAASAQFLRIPLPHASEALEGAAQELLRRNGLEEAVVRVALSRGSESPGLGLPDNGKPTVLVQARPFEPPPERLYRRGADVVLASVRQNADSPLPRHKTANYLLYLLARQEARDAGATDAVILNQHGQVCEATTANLFWAKGGGLGTPPVHCGLLPGVARANVLRIAGELGIAAEERPASAGELFEADEIFLTNSVAEVLPVRKVDGRNIGESAPGPLTRRLTEAYRQFVSSHP